MTRCPKCPAEWTGLKAAHCAACHITFSTPGNFDRHRPGECLPPESVGLVVLRKYENTSVWGQPGRDDADSRHDSFTQTAEQPSPVVRSTPGLPNAPTAI